MLFRIKNLLYDNYEYIVGVLAAVLVFRKVGTIALIIFFIFHLFYIRRFKFCKKSIIVLTIIAIPVLLDLLFIWNNESVAAGFKQMEKRSSLFLMPLCLLGLDRRLELIKILKTYSLLFVILLDILLIKFIVFNPDLAQKYLNGIHLWEMGYVFAQSTTVHAPALNMHVAFMTCSIFYLLIWFYKDGLALGNKLLWIFLLINAFFLLFFINTRLAIVNAVIGTFVIVAYEMFRQVSFKKLVTISVSIAVVIAIMFTAFAKAFPYINEKFTGIAFAHMDKVNKLDEIDRPEITAYSSLVTRVSIWNTAFDRALDDVWTGVGAADGKDQLNQAYIDTNQQFLAKYKFPTHNQYIDFLLKFGVVGFFGIIIFMSFILVLGIKIKNSLAIFFFWLFFSSNLTDDFLIRYDGITFSALWISIFAAMYFNNRQHKYQQGD
jgi:O-antigen ligase